MSIKQRLEEILALPYLEIPRDQLPSDIELDIFGQTNDIVRIRCSHTLYPALSNTELHSLLKALKPPLPDNLIEFYSHANGGELFKIKYPAGYTNARYHILNVSKLIEVNVELLVDYRSFLDSDNAKVAKLNYVAFCDVSDGNYLAIELENQTIFFLDHEYQFFPYDTLETHHAYKHVAPSLESWFAKLVESSGWDGLGGVTIPI